MAILDSVALGVFTACFEAAMCRAHYEFLGEGDDQFVGTIRDLPGVWATGPTLEDCRDELREVVEDWVLVGLARDQPIPPLGDVELIAANALATD